MSDPAYDLDFLLKAANYSGGPDAPHSEAARKAVDILADRFRIVAEKKLQITQRRLERLNVESAATSEDEQGLSI